MNLNKSLLNNWDFVLGSSNVAGIFTPWYVTGLTDAEGSFQITIQDSKGKGLTGFKPFLEFKITQKNHSQGILYELQKYFKCGRIIIDNRKTETMKFVVTNINDLLTKVIPHFDNYPLITSKCLNYIDFKSAVILMNNKKHFKLEGINELKSIKIKMNKARSFKEKYEFCSKENSMLKPEWIQGFIDGEGTFQCEILKNKINLNINVNFSLQIKQSNHDVIILDLIRIFFERGYLKPKYDIKNITTVINSVRKTTALWIRDTDVICAFINNYPLYTIKRLDYLDWSHLIELKKKNMHYTVDGLKRMQYIKINMNLHRFKQK